MAHDFTPEHYSALVEGQATTDLRLDLPVSFSVQPRAAGRNELSGMHEPEAVIFAASAPGHVSRTATGGGVQVTLAAEMSRADVLALIELLQRSLIATMPMPPCDDRRVYNVHWRQEAQRSPYSLASY